MFGAVGGQGSHRGRCFHVTLSPQGILRAALAPGGLWTLPDWEDENSGPPGEASGLPRGRPCTRWPQRSFQMQDPDQPLSFRSPPWGRTHSGRALGVNPAVREPLITTQGLGGLPPPLPAAWGKEGCECNLVVRTQPGPECTWRDLDSPLPAPPCPPVPLLGCQQSSGTQRAESRDRASGDLHRTPGVLKHLLWGSPPLSGPQLLFRP